MEQHYPNLFRSEPIIYQTAGDSTKEYKNFCEDYQRIITDVKDPFVPKDPKRNTRTYDIRMWEVWAVLNNAMIESDHKLLEYGAWPAFYCVYVSHFVSEVYAIDNFQGFGRSDGPILSSFHGMFPDVWISEINKYNRSNLKVLKMDIQQTSFEDKYFDRIVSYGVHEHIRDDLQGLKEIYRILKDDGIVSISIDFFHHGWPYHEDLQGRCYDPKTLTALVEGAGFTYINTPDWSQYDSSKDIINTVQDPRVYGIAIALKKI